MPPFKDSRVLKNLKHELNKCYGDIETANWKKEKAIEEYDKIIEDSEKKIPEIERAIAWLEQMPKEVEQ